MPPSHSFGVPKMVTELLVPRPGLIVPRPPSYVKLDMAFGVGAGTKLFDRSRYRNHGAITGASWNSGGRHGYCLDFDGSSYVDCGNAASIKTITNKITIEAWFYQHSANAYATIYSKGADDRELNFEGTTRKPRMVLRLNGSPQSLVSATVLALNTWYHLVGTYDKDGGKDNMKLYVNGDLDIHATKTGVMSTVDTSSYIGRRGDGYYFDGLIDLVRVLGITLAASEVKARYNAML